MQAATQNGFVFVGGRVGRAQSTQSTKSDFAPHFVAPDPAVVGARKEFQNALASLAEKFEALRRAAEDAGETVEVRFWEEGLERLKRGVG
jgi:hypothetical protein